MKIKFGMAQYCHGCLDRAKFVDRRWSIWLDTGRVENSVKYHGILAVPCPAWRPIYSDLSEILPTSVYIVAPVGRITSIFHYFTNFSTFGWLKMSIWSRRYPRCVSALSIKTSDASLYPVYTIQPYNRFDNRLYGVNKHPCQPCWTNSHCSFNRLSNPAWQPCWTNSCSFNRLSNQVVQPVWQPAVYTIQPVVNPVWQQVVSCKGGFTLEIRCGNVVGKNRQPVQLSRLHCSMQISAIWNYSVGCQPA